MGIAGIKVGKARKTYNVPAPKTSGNETWERMFRAQQNGVEWFPVFMALLWTGAFFGNQVIVAALGAVYVVGRFLYFSAYSSGGDRGLGFKLSFFPMLVICCTLFTILVVVLCIDIFNYDTDAPCVDRILLYIQGFSLKICNCCKCFFVNDF